MPRDLIRRSDRIRRWSGQRAEYPEVRMAVLWLGDEACDDVQLVGGKAANLTRLALGYRVPAGFLHHPRPVPSMADHPRPRAGPESRPEEPRVSSIDVLVTGFHSAAPFQQGRLIPVYRPDSLCDVRWNDRVVLRGRAPGRRLIDRVGRRIPTTSGLVILAVGVLPIAFAGQDVSIPTLFGGLSLVGIGLGLASPGL